MWNKDNLKNHKGMLGKKHSESAKKKIGEANRIINLGRKLSDETKKKMSESQKRIGNRPPVHRGAECYQWKGGITPINEQIRKSDEYKLWRKLVYERDKWTCVFCGSKIKIQADHIKSFADYPELRFAIDNGRTLCQECHRKTPTYGRQKK